MPYKRYAVDFWYRHVSDTERTVRPFCQMGSGADNEAEVKQVITELQAQGYLVQRVIMHDTCPACQGTGRISTAPKGTRKAKVSTLPAWRLKWSDCTVCQGDGYVDSAEIRVSDDSEVRANV